MLWKVIHLFVACLLMAAHFLRAGHGLLALGCLALPLLLVIEEEWTPDLVKWIAYAGAAVWVATTVALVQQRMAGGRPWQRLTLILLGVSLFTFAAGYLIGRLRTHPRYARRPSIRKDDAPPQ